MKLIRRTLQFKQDVTRMEKRGKDLIQLKGVLAAWVSGRELAAHLRDHVLVGQYKGTRECHLEPDWLLIYESTESELLLIRTGSHSDLFR
jgi:mRNA interferase YafQ